MSLNRYKNLLKSFSFQSFLWTQFLSAFNDNVFRIVLSLVAVNVAMDPAGASRYVSIAGAVFIIPFVLFSGYAGYLADVINKRSVLIAAKSFEIIAVTWGLFSFFTGRIELMFMGLFLMASHSAFFSPAKYGILPEIMPPEDLSSANGLLEMSTFLAIVLGTAIGSVMYSFWKDDLEIIGGILVVIAVAGTMLSFGIPRVPASGSVKKFTFNPLSEIIAGVKILFKKRQLLLAVGSITFFWFLGTLLQMLLLLLGKEVMHLSDMMIGVIVTFLAIGIGSGAVIAGRLSGDKIELGLSPLGAIGMGVCAMLLAYSTFSFVLTSIVLTLLGFFGGIFVVPLNAILQHKSGKEEKGRVIATNNFINTGGILGASAVLWLTRDIMNVPVEKIIFIFGGCAILLAVFLIAVLPQYLVRFTFWFLAHTVYKIRIEGRNNVPVCGPALIVSNHISFIDWLFISACVQRFIRFMIHSRYYEMKFLKSGLRLMKVIPVPDAGRKELFESIKMAREELKAGHVVCIFAEGMLSRTGNLLPFKKGIERIAGGLDVPIVPVHLDRVWGSVFSFKKGRFFWKMPERARRSVTVSFGAPLPSTAASEDVRHAIMELGAGAIAHRIDSGETLHTRFIKTARRRWFSPCVADSGGAELAFGAALTAAMLLSDWLEKEKGPEKFIGIMLPASAGAVVANAGAMLAGKTVVNLNFTAGHSSIQSAVRLCGIKTVITSRQFLSKARFFSKTEPGGLEGMVFLEDIAEGFGALKKAVKYISAIAIPSFLLARMYGRGTDASSLATVIFTSGSTGEPKGVMLSHRNILANTEGFSQVFHKLGRKDVLMGVLPFFHAFGFAGTLWFPLLNGFKAVYHSNPMDAKTVGEMVKKHGATALIATPAFYSAYVRNCSREEFSTVRIAISGAEKLRDGAANAFKEKFGLELLEGYGCTELSPVVAVNVPDVVHGKITQTGRRHGTVGQPIPGVAVKIVHAQSRERLYAGAEGILFVKGHSVTNGYLSDHLATGEMLEGGWYNTGDIASMDEDGFLRIVDRVSRFSKVAGEMVPHIRIEQAILDAGGGGAAVTAVPDGSRGERIVAFYTANDVTEGDLRARLLKTDMPRLWIPKKENIHFTREIPVAASGKADMKRIKAMALALQDKSEPEYG
ncbi:MAG: MFS transporter [Deltaproteobacteria bacterium]|nr:MFS transporter [Deltaproteobacteria bacterium]